VGSLVNHPSTNRLYGILTRRCFGQLFRSVFFNSHRTMHSLSRQIEAHCYRGHRLYNGNSKSLPDIEHRQNRYLNNRVENSHQPTRVRERQMKRFKSSEQAQRFLSVFESINAPFRLRRHLLSAARYRLLFNQPFHRWTKLPSRHLLHSSRCERLLASPQHRTIKLTMPYQINSVEVVAENCA
jgi:hypothetical protein